MPPSSGVYVQMSDVSHDEKCMWNGTWTRGRSSRHPLCLPPKVGMQGVFGFASLPSPGARPQI